MLVALVVPTWIEQQHSVPIKAKKTAMPLTTIASTFKWVCPHQVKTHAK